MDWLQDRLGDEPTLYEDEVPARAREVALPSTGWSLLALRGVGTFVLDLAKPSTSCPVGAKFAYSVVRFGNKDGDATEAFLLWGRHYASGRYARPM